jgi:phosphatidylinositol kinase/protein kinase (PI-3  family)
MIAMQIIKEIKEILEENNINSYIWIYQIFPLSSSSGVLEFLTDSVSIDGLKKIHGPSLFQGFWKIFLNDFEEKR